MQRHTINGSKCIPYVDLNQEEHRLTFKGKSYPQNPNKLYEPIYKWIDEYFSNIGDIETTLNFTLSYINASSTKCIIFLFEKLNEAYLKGCKIKLNWYYDEDNGFDYDMGCNIKEDLVIPFNFICCSSHD